MKKSILMIAVSTLLVVCITSCKKDDEKTGYDYLTEAKNGWKLTTATSDPAYQLEVGAPVTDLFQGFIRDCEKDDIMYFNTDKSQKLNPGKDKKSVVDLGEEEGYGCGDASEITLGTWELNAEETAFTRFYLPYYDENMTNNTIITLDENTLIVSVPIKDDVNNVTLTLTYTKQ